MTEHLRRYHKGRWAELRAALLLSAKAYRIRDWRYKTRHGEIDLIATKGKTIAFIEVKARNDYGAGVEAVSAKSQQRIQNAAQHYIQRYPHYQNYVWRFDVVVVSPCRLPYHVKDAWRAS